MSKRTKFLLGIGVIAALVIGWQVAAYAGAIGTAQGFEDDDGNLVVNSTFDWNGFKPVTWSPHPATTPTRITDDKTVSGFQFKGIEDYPNPGASSGTTADTSFNGGVKQDDNCAGVGTGKPPNKDDLSRVYLASKVVGGHTYLDLAWARIPQNSTSASAHVGFEFNKGSTACAGSSGLVQRSVGDMLIVYDFEGGSADPVLTVRRWVTSGACEVGSSSPPCWGPATNLSASGFAEAKVNTSTVDDDLSPPALNSATGASTTRQLATQEFGEAGIDLTAANIIPAGSCEGFGKAYAVSRSSGNSAQAQMKDLVGPANFNLQNCGTLKIIKHTNPRGLDQAFSFTSGQNAGGGGTGTLAGTCTKAKASFSLNDSGNTNSDNAANTQSCTDVPAGSYTVTEGADPTGFAFNNVTCTKSGTGTDATTSGKVATITMAAGGVVTCTYTNDQQLGAIKITKNSIKTAGTPPAPIPLAGAKFSITKGGTAITGSPFTTGADGTVCVDNLAFGDYVVTETQAPAGYAIDTTAGQTVTVDNNAKCSDASFGGETKTFTDTPLTDVVAKATSQATGGTASRITCVDSANANIGDSPKPSATGFADPVQVTANGLSPGTYTCTIVIDP